MRQQLNRRPKNIILMNNFQQEVLEAQVEIQKQAFERVGAELYDNIGQMLSVAKLYLYALEDSPLDDQQQAYVKQTNDIVGQSITDLRALIRNLES
ncbi:MAG: histidine kinase, partial [Runella zeae]